MLNIRHDKEHPEGFLTVYGNVYVKDEIDKYIEREAKEDLRANRMTMDDIHEGGKDLPTTIILRADKTTPFRVVNRMITLCQENGFRKFSLNSAMDEGRGP